MWIARDKDGRLTLFEGSPTKDVESGKWEYYTIFSDYRPSWEHWFDSKILDMELFPELTWDDEPIEVKLTEVSRNHFICDACNKRVNYDSDDIVDDETYGEYGADVVVCPHCGAKHCVNPWGMKIIKNYGSYKV